MRATRSIWNLIHMEFNTQKSKIEKPSLHMTKDELKRLTYNQANRLKKEVDSIVILLVCEFRYKKVMYFT